MADQHRNPLLDIACSVLSDLDLEVVLQRVLVSARDLTDARYAALGVLAPSGDLLERFLTLGIDDELRRSIGPLPRGRGVLGELIRHPAPLRLEDVGAHQSSYGFPVGHPPMTTFLGVPIVVAGRPFGNLYLTDKSNGEAFTDADESALVQLAELAGLAIDHARRFSGTAARADELQRSVAALDATVEIARSLAGHTDLDAILTLVAKRARALVSARMISVEYQADGELVVAALAGDVQPGLLGERLPLEGTVAATALRTGRTQRLEDALNQARFDQTGLGRFGVSARAGLVVPLVFHGRAYGALLAVDRIHDGPAFSANDVRLLEAFASSAAASIATAQTATDDRRAQRLAATENERRRWARELHDETLQNLAAVRIGLAAGLRASGADGALAEVVRQAVSDLETEIASLRSLITDLRPASLDELGIEAALEALAARARARGLDVDLGVDLDYEQGRSGERHVPELETAIYRIVQEALTNAMKHGQATKAVVEVGEDGPFIQVEVRDNGTGFDPDAESAGFGLLGMHERADLVDGTLTVSSRPGDGTMVTARLPLRRRAAEPGAEASTASG